MPHWLRYRFSDMLAFLLRHVVRYRRDVVRKNLTNSFPEKNTVALRQIEKRFYSNLADLFVETLQLLTMKADRLLKQFRIENKSMIDSALNKQKGIFIAIGHSGNWEWFAALLSLLFQGKAASLYKEQSSELFDRLIYRIRTRLGNLQLLESKSAYRSLSAKRNTALLVLIPGDQTPGGKKTDHWTTFLNQETPFFTGLEKMVMTLDYEVYFADLQRTGRGTYMAVVEPLETSNQQNQTVGITESYARKLEEAIRKQPDNWLWSHRRWKHKRNKAV